MEETKHRTAVQKSLYICDFCGEDVVADCVIKVDVEGSSIPVLNLTGTATISHRCKVSDVINKLRKELEWGIRNNA